METVYPRGGGIVECTCLCFHCHVLAQHNSNEEETAELALANPLHQVHGSLASNAVTARGFMKR